MYLHVVASRQPTRHYNMEATMGESRGVVGDTFRPPLFQRVFFPKLFDRE